MNIFYDILVARVYVFESDVISWPLSNSQAQSESLSLSDSQNKKMWLNDLSNFYIDKGKYE